MCLQHRVIVPKNHWLCVFNKVFNICYVPQIQREGGKKVILKI